MIKKIILSFCLLAGFINSRAAVDGDWKIYPSFDEEVSQVVATPNKIYIVALQHHYNPQDTKYSTYTDFLANLFVYDIETDEMMPYTTRDKLSDVRIRKITYNPDRKYLLIVYDSGVIDLLFDDGRVRSIQGLKSLTSIHNKTINDVKFSPENKEAYVATSFGYIVIDDNDCVISQSRILNANINSIARCGNTLFLADENNLYISNAKKSNLSLDEFKKVDSSELKYIKELMPMTSSRMAFYKEGSDYNSKNGLYIMDLDPANPEKEGEAQSVFPLNDQKLKNIQKLKDGYFFDFTWGFGSLYNTGVPVDVSAAGKSLSDSYTRSSLDLKTVWEVEGRKGLRQRAVDKNKDQSQWAIIKDYIFPSTPIACLSSSGNISYNPTYGILAANHSVTSAFQTYTYLYPNLLCGLKDGQWSIYSPTYNNEEYAGSILSHPRGPETDPDDNRYVYFGSWFNGMHRLNLADPKDVIHMTHPADADSTALGKSGYRKLLESNTEYRQLCHFSVPRFDSKGNLWTLHFNYEGADPGYPAKELGTIWVWPSADRKACNVDGWKRTGIHGFEIDKDCFIKPLKSDANKNLVIVSDGRSRMFILDTKGTVTDFSDDVSIELGSIYDQDGNMVKKNMVYDIYEDPSTSNVWVATDQGVFTYSPRKMFENPSFVRRIKVSRNDGTNLADYLLDGIGVIKIEADNAGNKWFATTGAGLVETSSDGTHVIRQLTQDNSYLPEDAIFDMGYNPATNSFLISTKAAYAEYFPPGSSTGNNFEGVKAYPNPVRPDYSGWITIEGLPDNSLIKITDAAGNLVKEIGHSVGGVVQWDGTNLTHAKVNSGVYYILMSGSDGGDATIANVGKILVVK